MNRFILIFVLFFYFLFHLTPFVELLNLKGLDFFRTNHPPHPDIVILAIDNKSLQKLGRWPWSRNIHAQIVNKASEGKPAVLGIDLILSEVESEEADQLLSQSLKKANYPIVLATEGVFVKGQDTPQKALLPLGLFTSSPNIEVGHVNFEADSDGLVRAFPKTLNIDRTKYLPFSLQLAKALNFQPHRNSYLINFAGSAGTFPTYSLADFLNNQIPQASLEGKIILIGATASDFHDTVLTPTKGQVISGAELQANILDNILLNRQLILLPKAASLGLGLIIGLTFLISFHKFNPRTVTLIMLGLAAMIPLLSYLFWQLNYVLVYFSNLLLTITLFVSHSLYRWYVSEKERRKVKQTFQPYFAPAVLEEILKDPESLKLGGQKREASILFSDIRSFTTITENLPPDKLTQLLKEYFTEMTKEILATDGVVDKFIGDAIMAFWGAPMKQHDHADRAVTSAINMYRKLKKLQPKWVKRGFPLIEAGFGINSGQVIVGNMGSKSRFDYTAIGDNVNIASRLEGLNKEFHSNIIISESTKNKLKIPVKFKDLGDVQIKGKAVPLKIYQVLLPKSFEKFTSKGSS